MLLQYNLKKQEKKYFFSYENLTIDQEDLVVVETSRGVEIGKVYMLKEIEASELTSELKPILRVATEGDIKEEAYNQSLEPGVLDTAKNQQLKMNQKLKFLERNIHLTAKDYLYILNQRVVSILEDQSRI